MYNKQAVTKGTDGASVTMLSLGHTVTLNCKPTPWIVYALHFKHEQLAALIPTYQEAPARGTAV